MEDVCSATLFSSLTLDSCELLDVLSKAKKYVEQQSIKKAKTKIIHWSSLGKPGEEGISGASSYSCCPTKQNHFVQKYIKKCVNDSDK